MWFTIVNVLIRHWFRLTKRADLTSLWTGFGKKRQRRAKFEPCYCRVKNKDGLQKRNVTHGVVWSYQRRWMAVQLRMSTKEQTTMWMVPVSLQFYGYIAVLWLRRESLCKFEKCRTLFFGQSRKAKLAWNLHIFVRWYVMIIFTSATQNFFSRVVIWIF